MREVYWLGGSPCSGKSSVAELLSARHGLLHYKCDDHFDRHLSRGYADALPVSRALKGASAEYIFMRSADENLALAWEIYREIFRYVLEDLKALSKPVLAEGAQLQPESLRETGVESERVFYLVPDEAFQRYYYAKRTWAPQRVADASNPVMALENWMERDVRYARRVAMDAGQLGYEVQWVDGAMTLEETADLVAKHMGLGSVCRSGNADAG